jgi:hypothetical protein
MNATILSLGSSSSHFARAADVSTALSSMRASPIASLVLK